MMKVKWHVDEVINKIERMKALSGDMRPVLLKIRGTSLTTDTMTIIGGITAQFVSRGSFFGSQWAPLSENYAKWKRKKYSGKTTLRRTDKLFKASAVQNSEGNVEVLDNNKIVWGVSEAEIPYAGVHQSGGKKTPKRQYIGFNEKQAAQWTRMIAGYLLDLEQLL